MVETTELDSWRICWKAVRAANGGEQGLAVLGGIRGWCPGSREPLMEVTMPLFSVNNTALLDTGAPFHRRRAVAVPLPVSSRVNTGSV